MIVEVANNHVPADGLTFSELSYGKGSDLSRAPFRIVSEGSEWKQKLGLTYESLVRELERDDQIVGRFQPPYDGAASYPTFDELIVLPQKPKMELIGTYLLFDILKLLLSEDAPHASWIVAEVVDVHVSDTTLTLSGFARR